MLMLHLLIAIAISAIDPLLLVAYVIAGLMAQSRRQAALFGVFSAVLVIGLMMVLLGKSPSPLSLAGQLAAGGLGALVARSVADMVRRKRAAA